MFFTFIIVFIVLNKYVLFCFLVFDKVINYVRIVVGVVLHLFGFAFVFNRSVVKSETDVCVCEVPHLLVRC